MVSEGNQTLYSAFAFVEWTNNNSVHYFMYGIYASPIFSTS